MITFIAALASTIVIEESAQEFHSLSFALCGDPQPAFLLINTLDLKLTLHLCPVSRGCDSSG